MLENPINNIYTACKYVNIINTSLKTIAKESIVQLNLIVGN
jgi:hypothetical protein